MYKLKTKSAVKKRFKMTASGELKGSQAGKNHFMRHKTNKQSRNLRKTVIIKTGIAKNIKKHFIPYTI